MSENCNLYAKYSHISFVQYVKCGTYVTHKCHNILSKQKNTTNAKKKKKNQKSEQKLKRIYACMYDI